MAQQDWYEAYLASKKRQTTPPAQTPTATDWYEDYKKQRTVTPNPQPASPTAPPSTGKSHGWLADTAWNFAGDAWDRIYGMGKGFLQSSEAWKGSEFNRRENEAREASAKGDTSKRLAWEAEQKEAYSHHPFSPNYKNKDSTYGMVKDALGVMTPMGALAAPLDIGEQVVEDVSQGNWGGLAGSAAVIGGGAYLGLRGVGKNKLANSVDTPPPPPDFSHNVPRGEYSPYPNPHIPARPQPFDVPYPPSPYNVPRAPEPPPGPSSVWPQRKLPARATTIDQPGTSTQDLYPRGPRTAPLLGLGQGTPYTGNQFFAGGPGGQPVTNIFDPSNIDIFGQSIDPSIAAQNTVRNPPVQPGFNPALKRPGTQMPLEGPLTYAPPPVEPVVAPPTVGKVGRKPKNAITPEVLPEGAVIPEGAKPVKAKAVQPVKPPKPVPISKLSNEELVERVRLGTATPEVMAQIAKRTKAAEAEAAKAARQAEREAKARAPLFPQAMGPTPEGVTTTPTVVEPPVVQPPVATLPKVEPVVTPDLTPTPDVEPPKGKLTKAELKTLEIALIQARGKYKHAQAEAQARNTPQYRQKAIDAMKELIAATKNWKEQTIPGAVQPKPAGVPDVTPIPEPAKVPDVEPIGKSNIKDQVAAQHYAGPDLKGKSIEELSEIAKTADRNTSAAIREEFIRRREEAAKKAGTNLGSGFGSLQDAPRILRQEFDEWRVLKNLPENQAAWEEFLRDTGRAVGIVGKRSGRFEESFKKDRQELTDINNIKDLRGLHYFWEANKREWIHSDNVEAVSHASQMIADIEAKIKAVREFDEINPSKQPKKSGQLFEEENKKIRDSWDPNKFHVELVGMSGKTTTPFNVEFDTLAKAEEYIKRQEGLGVEGLRIAEPAKKSIVPDVDQSVLEPKKSELSPVVTSKLEEDLPPVWDRIHELELEDLTNKAGTKEGLTWEELQRARELTKRKPNLERMDTHYKDDTPIKGETPMDEYKRLSKKGLSEELTRVEVKRARELRNQIAEETGVDPFDEAHEGIDLTPGYKVGDLEGMSNEWAKPAGDVWVIKKTDPPNVVEWRNELKELMTDTSIKWTDEVRARVDHLSELLDTVDNLRNQPESEFFSDKYEKPVVKPEAETENRMDFLHDLSIDELRDMAKTADSRAEADVIRQELARRRAVRSKGTTIHSGFAALQDAPALIKQEFDQWRVLKELPENQEAYNRFLKETGRLGTAAMRVPGKKGETVELPLEGMEEFERDRAAIGSSTPRGIGRTVSDIDLGTESRFGKRGTGREIPEAKPPVSRERFQQGIPDPKREDLKGLSFREIVEKGSKETKDRLEAEKIQAAIERGRQEAIEERQRAKTTASIVRREDRLRERKKKIDEKKAKVTAKKEAKKALEIPPAEVTDVRPTLINKMRNSKFMAANPQLKAITDKMIKRRSSGNLIGKGIRDKFKAIADIPKSQIVQFQEALGRGEYPEVRKFFDDLHDDLTARGIEMGEKDNYLPQLWEGKTKDLRNAFGDRTMTEKASFQFRSFIEDYKTGIDKKLVPAKSPIELIEWYGQRANKLIADNTALKELKAAGYLNKKQLVGMDEMDPNLGTFKGYYAEPKVKYIIENYLKSAESQSGFGHAVRKGAGKITSTMLSAGIPRIPLATFHGIGMGVRAGLEGGPRRLLKAVGYGLNTRKAARVLEAENAAMVKATQDHGFSTKVEYGGQKGRLFEDPDIGRTKKAFNWLSEGQHKLFEENLFEKMIPALKWDAWKANYAKFIKKGMSEAEAGAKATEVTNSFYSGKNVDLLYNDKNFNTLFEAVTLAPNWLRSTLDLGGKIPKSYVQLLKNPKNPVAQKYAMAGVRMATVYAGANLLQKALTGKFMVENEPQDIFNLHLGETSEGQPRSLKLFGTAGDFARIPAQIISATMKNMGGGEALAGATEARLSPIISMALGIRDGEDYQGNVNFFGTKDTYGNETSKGKRILNTALQGLSYGPPQLSAPVNYAAGRAGLEETIAKLVEAPIKYGRKKKSKPFSLEMPMPGNSSMQFPRTR